MWRNWSGQQACAAADERHPASAAEISAAVSDAARRAMRVRVAGAGHSFTDAVCTPDMLLALDRMAAVLEIDRGRGQVRVQAGCTLGELSAELARHDLALRNLGDVDAQTVGGALATGTHGTGVRLPTLAEELLGLEVIDGAGTLRTLTPGDDEEPFRAAQVSVGALGVVAAVTLRCQPGFRLRMSERPQDLDEVLDQLLELAAEHEHFEAFVFPYADQAITRCADRTDEPPTARPPVRRWLADVVVTNYVFEALLAAGAAAPALIPMFNRLAVSASGETTRVQSSHHALTSQRLMRFVEMEWILPAHVAATAIRSVRALINRHRLRINMPIELRFVAPDRGFLSPTYGRESCCVAVHVYRSMPWQPYFRAVERLMWDLGGRPHWGKLHFQTFETLRERYPAWDRFQAVRGRFDPEGRFRNAYTDRVLGVPGPVFS